MIDLPKNLKDLVAAPRMEIIKSKWEEQGAFYMPPLKPVQALWVLVFPNYESANNWWYMQKFQVSVKDWLVLYLEQHGRMADKSLTLKPNLIRANLRYNRIEISEFEFESINKQYRLNEYEKAKGWCPLCRGNGFAMAVSDKILMDAEGYLSPVYEIKCIHEVLNKKKGRRKNI